MKRLIMPFPFWIVVGLIVLACSGMTECRYDNFAIWQGNCSPNAVGVDREGRTYLSLSCPGFTFSRWPFSTSGAMVSLMAKRELPQSFWCSVTRSGNSTCVLPKKTEAK